MNLEVIMTRREKKIALGTSIHEEHAFGSVQTVLRDQGSWGSGCWTAGVASTLVTLHVAAHGEGLAAAGVGAAEGLLARVGVGVDAERRRAGEGLVAGAADIPVMVLLVRGGAGWREVVMVLPGRGDGGDERRRLGRGLVLLRLGLALRHRRRGDGRRGLERSGGGRASVVERL